MWVIENKPTVPLPTIRTRQGTRHRFVYANKLHDIGVTIHPVRRRAGHREQAAGQLRVGALIDRDSLAVLFAYTLRTHGWLVP